jgi:hypothetical protein
MNATKNTLQSRLYTLSEAHIVLKSLKSDLSTFKSKEPISEALMKSPKISAAPIS